MDGEHKVAGRHLGGTEAHGEQLAHGLRARPAAAAIPSARLLRRLHGLHKLRRLRYGECA